MSAFAIKPLRWTVASLVSAGFFIFNFLVQVMGYMTMPSLRNTGSIWNMADRYWFCKDAAGHYFRQNFLILCAMSILVLIINFFLFRKVLRNAWLFAFILTAAFFLLTLFTLYFEHRHYIEVNVELMNR
jgi:hypothetical protein